MLETIERTTANLRTFADRLIYIKPPFARALSQVFAPDMLSHLRREYGAFDGAGAANVLVARFMDQSDPDFGVQAMEYHLAQFGLQHVLSAKIDSSQLPGVGSSHLDSSGVYAIFWAREGKALAKDSEVDLRMGIKTPVFAAVPFPLKRWQDKVAAMNNPHENPTRFSHLMSVAGAVSRLLVHRFDARRLRISSQNGAYGPQLQIQT